MSDSPATRGEETKARTGANDSSYSESGEPVPQSAMNGAPKGDGASSAAPAAPDAGSQRKSFMKPLIWVIVIVVLAVAGTWGLNYWHYTQNHISTDDAYVTGDLVNVSPTVSGTLLELDVDEGDYVRKGQLIAKLKDEAPRAAVRQARANYQAALSQIPQAERTLLYEQEATNAALQRAQAALQVQNAKTGGSQRQVTLTADTTANQVRQAQGQLAAAQASGSQAAAQANAADVAVEGNRQAVVTAQASLANYEQQVITAGRAVAAAQARAEAAQSEMERTTKEEARFRVLYAQDAVSAQVYDNAKAQARSAQANLEAARSQAEEAQSQQEQARAGVQQAQSQVEQARKSVAQAEAQARAAHRAAEAAQKQVTVARAGIGLAQANLGQVGVQQSNLAATRGQTGESLADIATARAGEQQVAARRSQVDIYRSQAKQALAALNTAEINLSHTRIYAETDGIVVKKIANIGASMQPGQAILTMTLGKNVWVDANYKETQLKDVQPGLAAEVEVDAVPGKVFKGRVQSINEATGAATALLPPDNSTGNFTKVVQRVPVRIELIPANDNEDQKFARQKDIDNLRQGMSVTAIVDTNSQRVNMNKASRSASGKRNDRAARAVSQLSLTSGDSQRGARE